LDNKQIILDFIRNFKGSEKTFLNGCCYWFAFILKSRFRGLTYYDPIYGHFVQKIGSSFYDIRGDVSEEYKNKALVCWDTYKQEDPAHYKRIVRDCVLKIKPKDV